jgi:hypothetical protein
MNPACLVIGRFKTFRTDWRKPFLETASSSHRFRRIYEFGTDGKKKTTIMFKKVA